MTTLSLSLAKNPAVMDTLLREIDTILEEHDGVVNHETIADMPYLEACIKVSVQFKFILSFSMNYLRKTFASTLQ